MFSASVQMAERQADHLVAHHRRAAAVAGIDGGVNLDAQAGDREVIRREFHPRNDALGDGKAVAAFGIAVGHDRRP